MSDTTIIMSMAQQGIEEHPDFLLEQDRHEATLELAIHDTVESLPEGEKEKAREELNAFYDRLTSMQPEEIDEMLEDLFKEFKERKAKSA